MWEREMLPLGKGVTLFHLPEARFHRSLDGLRVITSHLLWIRPRLRLLRMTMPRKALAWGWSRGDEDHVEGWTHVETVYQEHGAVAGLCGNHPQKGTERDRVVPEIWTIPLSGVAMRTPHASRRTHETWADRVGSHYPGDRPLWAGICKSFNSYIGVR